jgi:hypothetical protein
MGFYRSRRPCLASELLLPWQRGHPHGPPGARSPHPRRPALGLSCWCPPVIGIALVICLRRSHFSYFHYDLKSGALVTGVMPHCSRTIVGLQHARRFPRACRWWHHQLRAWVTELRSLSHPVFKAKTKCSSYVCPGSSCHTRSECKHRIPVSLLYRILLQKFITRLERTKQKQAKYTK